MSKNLIQRKNQTPKSKLPIWLSEEIKSDLALRQKQYELEQIERSAGFWISQGISQHQQPSQ